MNPSEQSTYGLIGYPVKHSLSPVMHNTAFQELEVEAVYKLFPLEEREIEDFFVELRKKECSIFGLNVTVPYKEKVIGYLDSLSPYAKKVQAVNTIVISKNRALVGYNTDGPGFLAHLKELEFDPADKRIALIGAGGAARAIISVLCLLPKKPKSLKVFDIDKLKAEKLIRDLAHQGIDLGMVESVHALDDLNVELADLLINATPIGMNEKDPCLIEEDLLHKGMLVYDLIYNPAETTLLKCAKRRQARVANGLGMLFYQGVLAFQHWANVELDPAIKDKMKQRLLESNPK